MAREIIKEDKKIKSILLERKELIEKGREITKQIEELETERNKIALKAEKLRDKIVPWANKIRKEECGTYENIEKIEPVYDDPNDYQIKITIFDAVEEYKKALDEKIKQGKW